MKKILIVEDDKLLNKGVKFALEIEGYTILDTYNYEEGYKAFLKDKVDLVLLDINLPDESGSKLSMEIRKNSEIPIIFITAKDTESDIIDGFKLGCDDYISKPFSIEVLKQRIKAVLRRTNLVENTVFVYEDITIDFNKMDVKKDGISIKLTAKEYRLLELLVKNSGQVLTRRTILEKLWDTDGNFVDENALNVNIRRLRKKIEDDSKNPKYIITVFSIGYTWGKTS
ncbi:response regulator transcription factor [Clostridium botulinum]|uniref:response regulator transcription factor n=1 Tax=Clostridium botulinum TaxID=1491 RepID=UPI0004DA85D0|nr:response regulator transcription factor [Clostridium botulinum]MCD3203143.1 response regulator transcription factor [Clostridium botulinum C/D]KEI02672.1 transcriptional regulator [Clostridium botulinum D str. 16868]KLU76542.1 transcriptional regulator [Clostridium botulinum V891]KOA72817.1 transcriptional regulator [Clostridium botulinum]KOA91309.1 transcriptional regulator [Clostridium botulinum]